MNETEHLIFEVSRSQTHARAHTDFHHVELAAETVQMIHVSAYLHHLSVEPRGSIFQTLRLVLHSNTASATH